MEVHTHTHTPRRKWTHYFWEFIMLFLAVFCGFLAENKREHVVEGHRAKEYAKSLVEDLAADTTELLDVMKEDRIVLSCFDSLNTMIHRGFKNNIVPGSFYYYCNIGTVSPRVLWNDATLTQVTQSGNLRYFKNEELVKKLSSYYSYNRYISNLNDGDIRYRDECIRLRNVIVDNYYYNRYSALSILDWLQVNDSLLKVQIPLKSFDPILLNEFANSFDTRRRVLSALLSRYYPDVLQHAKQLIGLIKEEYNLD